jgi:hypothetical protein
VRPFSWRRPSISAATNCQTFCADAAAAAAGVTEADAVAVARLQSVGIAQEPLHRIGPDADPDVVGKIAAKAIAVLGRLLLANRTRSSEWWDAKRGYWRHCRLKRRR